MSHLLANIFLGCFLVGFALTLISLLFGFDHGGGEGVHFGDGSGMDMGDGGDAGDGGGGGHHASFFSYTGMLMFLTCFGGVGYILNRHASGALLFILTGSVVAGMLGATVMFLYFNHFLRHGETPMNPSDYQMAGTLGRITSGIRLGETGEVTYVQGGARKTIGARSDEDLPHPQGEEVVIVRYERGLAYVRSVRDELKIL
ncbi:hypothetical protein CVU37_04305 [candidate division BRC1 bacterium HGW-BRC1-1]|nr:MAG: hypothetical protein CVU37_04305 [candidate division BRC1 bacterium HGW-BRC1-1]